MKIFQLTRLLQPKVKSVNYKILSSLHHNHKGSKMIELSVIRDLVAIFGVIAGFTYYVLSVRNANRSRQTQIFMPIYTYMWNVDLNSKWFEVMFKYSRVLNYP